MKNFSAYIILLSFFNDYVMNLNSKMIQIGNNIDEILYDHDGIKNEISSLRFKNNLSSIKQGQPREGGSSHGPSPPPHITLC